MQTKTRTTKQRVLVAALAVGMMVPAATAYASSTQVGEKRDAETATQSERHIERRVATRPVVAIDHVYRGALDGAIGIHTWTGDLFGTGDITTVNYEIALGAGGVPAVASVVVDESTLPEGATYEMRGATVKTDEASSDEAGSDAASDEEPADEGTEDQSKDDEADDAVTTVDVSATVSEDTSAGDEASEEGAAEDADDETTTRFAGNARVRFSMGDRWAGLLILVHGVLGDDPAVAVRTVFVSPSSMVERPDEASAEAAEPPADKPDRAPVEEVRADDRPDDGDGDRSTKRGDRAEHDRDGGRGNERGGGSDDDRGGDDSRHRRDR